MQKNQLSGVREMSSKILAFQNHHFVGTDDEGAAKWWGFCLSKKSPSLSSCGCESKLTAGRKRKMLMSILRLLLQLRTESVVETGFAR